MSASGVGYYPVLSYFDGIAFLMCQFPVLPIRLSCLGSLVSSYLASSRLVSSLRRMCCLKIETLVSTLF